MMQLEVDSLLVTALYRCMAARIACCVVDSDGGWVGDQTPSHAPLSVAYTSAEMNDTNALFVQTFYSPPPNR